MAQATTNETCKSTHNLSYRPLSTPVPTQSVPLEGRNTQEQDRSPKKNKQLAQTETDASHRDFNTTDLPNNEISSLFEKKPYLLSNARSSGDASTASRSSSIDTESNHYSSPSSSPSGHESLSRACSPTLTASSYTPFEFGSNSDKSPNEKLHSPKPTRAAKRKLPAESVSVTDTPAKLQRLLEPFFQAFYDEASKEKPMRDSLSNSFAGMSSVALDACQLCEAETAIENGNEKFDSYAQKILDACTDIESLKSNLSTVSNLSNIDSHTKEISKRKILKKFTELSKKNFILFQKVNSYLAYPIQFDIQHIDTDTLEQEQFEKFLSEAKCFMKKSSEMIKIIPKTCMMFAGNSQDPSCYFGVSGEPEKAQKILNILTSQGMPVLLMPSPPKTDKYSKMVAEYRTLSHLIQKNSSASTLNEIRSAYETSCDAVYDSPGRYLEALHQLRNTIQKTNPNSEVPNLLSPSKAPKVSSSNYLVAFKADIITLSQTEPYKSLFAFDGLAEDAQQELSRQFLVRMLVTLESSCVEHQIPSEFFNINRTYYGISGKAESQYSIRSIDEKGPERKLGEWKNCCHCSASFIEQLRSLQMRARKIPPLDLSLTLNDH